MNKKVLAILLAAALLIAVCAGCAAKETKQDASASNASSGGTVTIRYGSADSEDTAVVQGLLAFEKYVEEASNGTIQVEPYINGVLGGDRELCEGLQLGTVDMTMVLGAILGNYDPSFNIFALPYLWTSKQASYDAIEGEFGQTMIERADAIGFKLLGFGDAGAYEIGLNGKQAATVAELSGIKLRGPESEVDIAFFKALGASPSPISFSETYTALEQGVANGLELPVELMYSSQYFDTLTSITMTNHFQAPFPILMSNNMWNSLSADQQQIVLDGIAKQIEVNREIAADAESKALKVFEDSGKTVIYPDDAAMAEFEAIGKQVQEEYRDKVGSDLLDLAASYNK